MYRNVIVTNVINGNVYSIRVLPLSNNPLSIIIYRLLKSMSFSFLTFKIKALCKINIKVFFCFFDFV